MSQSGEYTYKYAFFVHVSSLRRVRARCLASLSCKLLQPASVVHAFLDLRKILPDVLNPVFH